MTEDGDCGFKVVIIIIYVNPDLSGLSAVLVHDLRGQPRHGLGVVTSVGRDGAGLPPEDDPRTVGRTSASPAAAARAAETVMGLDRVGPRFLFLGRVGGPVAQVLRRVGPVAQVLWVFAITKT